MLFFLICTNLYSQTDFRGLTWGMSMEQVREKETAPLTKEEKNFVGYRNGKEYYDGMSLLYENVTVGGKNSDIYYEFTNGKLIKARVVYRLTLYGYEGEMSQIIDGFKDLFASFSRRGFSFTDPIQCGDHAYRGPDYKNEDNRTIRMMEDWNIDRKKLLLVDKMISERKYKSAFFRIENDRTRGVMMFYTKYSEMKDIAPAVLELYPTQPIEKKIKDADF